MRSRLLAPVILSFFAAAACGGKEDQSQVEGGGTAATGNNGAAGNGLVVGSGGGSASGNSSNGSGGAFDPSMKCADTSADGEPIQVDLYFMVDITGSMNCPVPDKGPCDVDPGAPTSGESRWTVVSAALKAFVADPLNQGLGVGMRFFPSRNNICNVDSYRRPTVEIGPLSMTAMRIADAIDNQGPGGQTPTAPSLDAAIDHASAWAMAHPTHRVAVVYATDGYPKGCTGNTIEAAARLAQAGFAATPSIPVYVLGVGPNLTNLNSVAASGGTGKAFLVDTTQNAAAQLTAALATIRTSTVLDCTYTIPAPPTGQALERGKVNVTYTNSKGEVTNVLQDPESTACSAGSGWQYSKDDAEITLCGSACSAVKADPGGSVQVRFGCLTQVGNPPK